MSPAKVKRAERLNVMNNELRKGKITPCEYNAEMACLYTLSGDEELNYHYRVDDLVTGDVSFFVRVKEAVSSHKNLSFNNVYALKSGEVRAISGLEIERGAWDKGLIDAINNGLKMPYDEAKLTVAKGDI